MTSDERFMDTQQVASYLGIHEKQVYTLIHGRRLPATKITGKWLFPRHLVDTWLESNVINMPEAQPFLKAAGELLLIAGSDDPLLVKLTALFRKRSPDILVLQSRAGSRDGLLALKKGLVHIACVHLLDPEGGYATDHIRDILGADITVITFAERTQGLLLPAGNPMAIQSMEDALRRPLRWAIREVGTGTRTLLDRELDNHAVEPGLLLKGAVPTGSHLETALSVLTGKADVGLGIQAVAGMTGCSFAPIRQERFDLIIRKENYFMEQVQEMLKLLADREFHELAALLPGYDVTGSGRIVME